MPFTEETKQAIEDPATQGGLDGAQPEGTPSTESAQSQDQGFALEVNGRQYRSKEDIVNKIVNADAHIQRIEKENAELRRKVEELTEKLLQARDVDEVLSRLDEDKEDGEKRTQALTPEQVHEMVMKSLKEVQTKEKQERNLQECMEKARAVYGDNFNSKVAAMAKEMGMSLEEVNRLAANQPALFEKAFLPSGGSRSNNGFVSGDLRTPVVQPAPQAEVKAPLSVHNAKDRARNFEAALQEYLRKLN